MACGREPEHLSLAKLPEQYGNLGRAERIAELYWAILATQALGGVPVPLYQDSIEKELAYIVEHAEARFAVAEDQEQVDKLLHVREQCPRLEFIVYVDARGLRAYSEPCLLSLAELEERGDEARPRPADLLRGRDGQGRGRGHRGHLLHLGHDRGAQGRDAVIPQPDRDGPHRDRAGGARPDDEALAYLPMAWVGDHMLSYAQAIVAGFTINCPESADTVLHDLKEIGPTYFFAPPRIWENLLTSVMIRIEDAAWPKRRLTRFFLGLAQAGERRRLAGQPAAAADARCWRPSATCSSTVRCATTWGMRRIRIAYTAGEALGPEIFVFFRALGINVKQLYGMTEASVFVAVQKDGEVRLDTVGPPMPGVEIKISESGEVLFRSPGVFQGYFKNPEATRQTLEDGWIHSGDAGFLDQAGHLKIIDRAKDLGRLTDGTMFAPKYLENKLKFSPFVKEAVALAPGRPYVTMLVNIDLAAVGNWAERRGIAYTSYTDLSQKPEVYELVQQEVMRVNQSLALEDEVLRGAQIRKFLILHKELDPDDEEITRTRKVRRGHIAQRYAALIEALYGEGDHVSVEAQVTYEDGRRGTVRADVAIRELTTR